MPVKQYTNANVVAINTDGKPDENPMEEPVTSTNEETIVTIDINSPENVPVDRVFATLVGVKTATVELVDVDGEVVAVVI